MDKDIRVLQEMVMLDSLYELGVGVKIKHSSISDIDNDTMEIIDSFHAERFIALFLEDKYFCGIRANHFIVEYGWSEISGKFYYLVTANHKGQRCITLIESGLYGEEEDNYIKSNYCKEFYINV